MTPQQFDALQTMIHAMIRHDAAPSYENARYGDKVVAEARKLFVVEPAKEIKL